MAGTQPRAAAVIRAPERYRVASAHHGRPHCGRANLLRRPQLRRRRGQLRCAALLHPHRLHLGDRIGAVRRGARPRRHLRRHHDHRLGAHHRSPQLTRIARPHPMTAWRRQRGWPRSTLYRHRRSTERATASLHLAGGGTLPPREPHRRRPHRLDGAARAERADRHRRHMPRSDCPRAGRAARRVGRADPGHRHGPAPHAVSGNDHLSADDADSRREGHRRFAGAARLRPRLLSKRAWR